MYDNDADEHDVDVAGVSNDADNDVDDGRPPGCVSKTVVVVALLVMAFVVWLLLVLLVAFAAFDVGVVVVVSKI